MAVSCPMWQKRLPQFLPGRARDGASKRNDYTILVSISLSAFDIVGATQRKTELIVII